MLLALTIRDFVIVHTLALEFGAGFTALTGETGAGKSILIDALALALGARAESGAGVVRQGADKADISASFDAPPALRAWLEAQDLADEDGCLLRRVIDAAGRSRAFINGRAATLAQLREAGEYLVDIHGQHEHQSLTRGEHQRALLDAYGGHGELAQAVARAWRARQDARERLALLERDAGAAAAEREQLEWQIRDIESLGFDPAAWEEEQAEHARLAHGQGLLDAAQFALDTLSESEPAAAAQLAAVQSRLEHVLEHDARLKDILDIVASAQAQAQEAAYMLRDYQERLDLDPQRFQKIEQRLDAVHAMARKWRVQPEALAATLQAAQARLEALGGDGDIDSARARADAAQQAYAADAKKLGAARRKAAKKLSDSVTAAMQTLAMAGGVFEIALHAVEDGGAGGTEQVEFNVSAHKGVAPRPLAKTASGGELSRISLAIQAAASAAAPVPTLIFDEVDSGIGGRVAEIVGRLLHTLGRSHQVMCVTHLPQVAASADHQWQVSKGEAGGLPQSRVVALAQDERVEEIARMLGGVRITDTTRKHAAEMLSAAR